MIDIGDLPIPQFDEEEFHIRYIESRSIERSILTEIKELLATLRKTPDDQSSLKYDKDSLESDLQRRYNDWQFFYDKKEGLNSGGCGEAFNRLLGMGILEDLPELCDLPKNTSGYGVCILKQPVSMHDKAVIEVITFIGRTSEYQGCKFKFIASESDIEERLRSIADEIETQIQNNRNKK